jgi:CheY-like chemotaxis protein
MTGLLTGARILVVDDDEDTLELCVMIFSNEGAAVVAAANAQDAYSLLCAGGFDILVSDILMPGNDGYWLIEQVRALKSEIRAIPALALSAHASTSARYGVISAGYHRHVAKPVDPAELVAAVGALLK